ncbi:MAG: rod shape-determining protein MreC [Actinomycetota bacterium]|nr:rod shape-determining protein MreC [Actinomycetota bacterium]
MYRRATKQRIALAALLALTATIVTLDFKQNPGGPIRRAQHAAVSIVAPLQDGLARVFRPVGKFLSTLGQIPSISKENARLNAEIDNLKEVQRRVPEIVRENDRLLELLKEKDWQKGRSTGAFIIGVGPSNEEWTAFLDKGSSNEVANDMAVVSSEGLVGRVVLEGADYSKVLLLIDPQHAVGARLTNSGETGVIQGRGQEDLRFEFLDPETKISLGETVVTSGYDKGIYPAGIPIGRVTSVQKSKDGLSQTAFVRPFVDFSRLDAVLVLLDSGPKVPRGSP